MLARKLRNTPIIVILILVIIGGVIFALLSPIQVLGNPVGNDPYPPLIEETHSPTTPHQTLLPVPAALLPHAMDQW
jgi:hypothetical protein